jgi:hypothetical protein
LANLPRATANTRVVVPGTPLFVRNTVTCGRPVAAGIVDTPKVAEAPLLDACPTVRIASAFHPEILAGMPCPYVMMSSRGSDGGRLSHCAVTFASGAMESPRHIVHADAPIFR